jgi:hypothetical protein
MIPVGILTAAATSSFSYLLDDYPGAAAAYSLRKLRSAYTGAAIRVNRGVDAMQMDIGFVNGELDTTTLLAFVGGVAATSQVLIWYDQSGNGNNATASAVTAPKIVNLGVLQILGTKPAITFNSINFFNLTTGIVNNTNLGIFMTGKNDATNLDGLMLGNLTGNVAYFGYAQDVNNRNTVYLGGLNSVIKLATNNTWNNAIYYCTNLINNSSNISVFKNNTSVSLNISNAGSVSTFQRIGGSIGFFTQGKFQELIFYKTDQLANRTGIVNNTNSFYTIF